MTILMNVVLSHLKKWNNIGSVADSSLLKRQTK